MSPPRDDLEPLIGSIALARRDVSWNTSSILGARAFAVIGGRVSTRTIHFFEISCVPGVSVSNL